MYQGSSLVWTHIWAVQKLWAFFLCPWAFRDALTVTCLWSSLLLWACLPRKRKLTTTLTGCNLNSWPQAWHGHSTSLTTWLYFSNHLSYPLFYYCFTFIFSNLQQVFLPALSQHMLFFVFFYWRKNKKRRYQQRTCSHVLTIKSTTLPARSTYVPGHLAAYLSVLLLCPSCCSVPTEAKPWPGADDPILSLTQDPCFCNSPPPSCIVHFPFLLEHFWEKKKATTLAILTLYFSSTFYF